MIFSFVFCINKIAMNFELAARKDEHIESDFALKNLLK
jgi:hypothetical protein